ALLHAVRQRGLRGEVLTLLRIPCLVHVEQDRDVRDELDGRTNESGRPIRASTTVRSCRLRDLALVEFRRLLGHEDTLAAPAAPTRCLACDASSRRNSSC